MIHLVITTANVKDFYEKRKQQYITSIESVLKYRELFDSLTVLECSSTAEDYLNTYPVYYSKVQNVFPEKGLNEMQHLKAFLENSSFDNGDMVIKLTGRYVLEDNSFLHKIRILQEDYDSVFKDDSDIYVGRGYHTFLYGIRKQRFLATINSLNFSMENSDPIEWGVKDYLKAQPRNYEIARLGVIAYQGLNSEKVFRC